MKNDQVKAGPNDPSSNSLQKGSQPTQQPPVGNEQSNIGVDNEGRIKKEDRWNTTDQKQGKHKPDATDFGTFNKRRPSMEEPEIDTPALSPDDPPQMKTNQQR